MFLWNCLAILMIQKMLALISGSFAFSKSSLNIWKFMVHVLLKPGLKNFEHYFTSMWDECNCAVVWAFFGIAFLWDWNENWHISLIDVIALEWQGLLALLVSSPVLSAQDFCMFSLSDWLSFSLQALYCGSSPGQVCGYFDQLVCSDEP